MGQVSFQTATSVLAIVATGFVTNPRFQAQSVSMIATGTVARIDGPAQISGSPTDNLVYGLQTNSGGSPSSSYMGTASIAAGALSNTNPGNTYTITPPVSVISGELWWVATSRTGALNDTNNYEILGSGAGNNYPNGSTKRFDGTSWQNGDPNIDFNVTIYIDTPDAPLDSRDGRNLLILGAG